MRDTALFRDTACSQRLQSSRKLTETETGEGRRESDRCVEKKKKKKGRDRQQERDERL